MGKPTEEIWYWDFRSEIGECKTWVEEQKPCDSDGLGCAEVYFGMQFIEKLREFDLTDTGRNSVWSINEDDIIIETPNKDESRNQTFWRLTDIKDSQGRILAVWPD